MATILGKGASYPLHVKHATLTYEDTSATDLFDLPSGAYLHDIKVDVQTAVSGGTTTADFGKSGDGDYFVDGVDVSSEGRASPTVLQGGEVVDADRPTTIVGSVGAGNSAGALTVMISYFWLDHSHLH